MVSSTSKSYELRLYWGQSFCFRSAEVKSLSRWGHVCKHHETCPTFTPVSTDRSGRHLFTRLAFGKLSIHWIHSFPDPRDWVGNWRSSEYRKETINEHLSPEERQTPAWPSLPGQNIYICQLYQCEQLHILLYFDNILTWIIIPSCFVLLLMSARNTWVKSMKD